MNTFQIVTFQWSSFIKNIVSCQNKFKGIFVISAGERRSVYPAFHVGWAFWLLFKIKKKKRQCKKRGIFVWMCIKKSRSCPVRSNVQWRLGQDAPWGARLSLALYLKFSGDGIPWHVVFGAHTDPRVVPGVRDPAGIGGSCLWRRELPASARDGNGVPLLALQSIICSLRHPTSAQSKTARGVYSFSSWFYFYHFHFGRVFDSFYLLSHHLSSCTGAAPDVPNPRAGLSNHHLKINPVREVGFFPLFIFFMPPTAFPTVCSLCYTRRVFYRCDAFTLLRMALPFITSRHRVSRGGTVCCNQITVQLLEITVSDSAPSTLLLLRWIFLVVNHNLSTNWFS